MIKIGKDQFTGKTAVILSNGASFCSLSEFVTYLKNTTFAWFYVLILPNDWEIKYQSIADSYYYGEIGAYDVYRKINASK